MFIDALPRHGVHSRSHRAHSRAAREKSALVHALILISTIATISCQGPMTSSLRRPPDYIDGAAGLSALAIRFAPILYVHPEEPYHIMGVIAVLHPARPLIAYHVFFDDDAFLAGRGKSLDHEIVWIEYDPVTLKVTDVLTLWHRTVLRSGLPLMETTTPDGRARIDVQWGQHGMLPFGWKELVTARPRLELRMHYELVHNVNRVPKASATKPIVFFGGSFDEYIEFSVPIDAADYIHEPDVVRVEHSLEHIISRTGKTLILKKEWPDW
jgi:hypothetical protein